VFLIPFLLMIHSLFRDQTHPGLTCCYSPKARPRLGVPCKMR
jgi:hypothetical protein